MFVRRLSVKRRDYMYKQTMSDDGKGEEGELS